MEGLETQVISDTLAASQAIAQMSRTVEVSDFTISSYVPNTWVVEEDTLLAVYSHEGNSEMRESRSPSMRSSC